MSKITGLEAPNQVPPKVTAMYRAVSTLLREDKDISEMSVSMITGLAGIGKGTAYEYFDSKEEIIVCALSMIWRTKRSTGPFSFCSAIRCRRRFPSLE